MDLKGMIELRNAFNHIQNDLIILRQKISEENNGIFNEINSMISFIRQNENYLEKNPFVNELQVTSDSSFSNSGDSDALWKCYKEVLLQIFPTFNSISGLSFQDLSKVQNNEYDLAQNSYLQSKIYFPLQQTLNGSNWSQICNQLNSDNITMISPGTNSVNVADNKNSFRNHIFTQNKISPNVNELFSMHGAGDTIGLHRTKLPPQPEKDIEEIQQTISMQLKLQQHHSKNRYKFQQTHRAWPITPEINVVFQGNSSTNQFPIQNQLFSSNSDPQIFTPNTIVGLHTQYQSQQPNVSQLLNHSLATSNNSFYGFNNAYTNQLTNTQILQANDSEFAQLPSSMFGFLNNSSTNRMVNCSLNSTNSSNSGININVDCPDSPEVTNSQNSYIINNSFASKTCENPSLSKICDPKSNLINYQIKPPTLTWEDLASVTTTSTN